jgi:hypothetical protein
MKTMARMGVDYDLLTWEGGVLRLKFWAQAFDVLKAKGPCICRRKGAWQDMGYANQEDLETNPGNLTPTKSARRSSSVEWRRDVCRQGHRVQFWKLGWKVSITGSLTAAAGS